LDGPECCCGAAQLTGWLRYTALAAAAAATALPNSPDNFQSTELIPPPAVCTAV
jgi:hypothetical protein